MKRLIFLLITLTCLFISAKSQIKEFGRIKIIEEKEITDLISQNEEEIEGYRIQIFTGNANERAEAQRIKESVEENFGVSAYVDYESPLFKVRVGDFSDKIEAIGLKNKLKQEYRNAYIVKTKLSLTTPLQEDILR